MALIDIDEKAPWQEKGCWYRAFVESDGTNITLTSIDAELSGADITSGCLRLPKGYTIVDFKCVTHNDYDGTSSTHPQQLVFYSNDRMGFNLPKANSFDYSDIYIFAFNH